jgi:integrase
MNEFTNNNLTTESLSEWWNTMKQKGAEYLSLGREGKTYKLHARKHGEKQRLGQISLSTSDKKYADRILGLLLADETDTSPASVIRQYFEHKLRMVDVCQDNKESHRRFVEPRKKTAKTNLSRLTCHLLPFCKKFHIHDTRDLYQRKNIGLFLNFLTETVDEPATCVSIVKTTKAFLRWYDITKKVHLINSDYIAAFSESSSILGHKKHTEKPFLGDEQCKQILATKIVDFELRAMVIAHMVGGLRDIEIQGLRWKDLNAKEGWLNVINAKGAIARYAQYPLVMQEAFLDIQRNRTHNILGNDYVFTQSSYNKRNEKVKAFVRKVTGIVGNDYAGNCLRRTGCACIQNKHPGLGDKQLGHAVNSRVTEMHYSNPRDFRNVNRFWDDLWKEVKEQGLISVNLSDDLSNVIRI